jgi:UDP-glucose 4-epimerase
LVRGAREVYFAAGVTGPANGFERYEDFVQVNEVGLANVLDAVRRQGSDARIVYPSTRLVYRGGPGRLSEDSELELKTPYALSKFAGEQLLRMYGSTFALNWVVFRVCVAYGEVVPGRRVSHGTVTAYLEQARNGEDLVVFGDGSQRRTLTHVADIAAAMIDGARDQRTSRQVLNVGGPDELSVLDIANLIAGAHGVSVRHAPWPDLAASIESGDTVFDASRLEGWVGRNYRYRFEEWVRRDSV